MLKRFLYCLFLVLAGLSTGIAQTQVPTTQGTEFWVSFMRNGYRNRGAENLTLIASAKRSCQVTVTNPHTGYTSTFSVPNQGVHTVQIPDAEGYNEQQSGKAYKGLLVISTDTISLYVANEADNSYDAANVLPVNALGSQYMVQSNKSIGEQGSIHLNENRASFLIIATEDDTQVRISPTCETWDSNVRPYTVTLQTGECYHVLNKYQGEEGNNDGDFSGTLIESIDEKPIAVFNGNCITAIPGGTSSGYNHIFEQAMPVDHWGKRFVVTSTLAPSTYNLLNDQVKITALYNNTTVWRDGVELPDKLGAGESYSYEIDLNEHPYSFLESDNPIAVYLYNHSHRQAQSGNTYGDPSMVWISPVEQTIREIIFSTFQGANIKKHYLNLVCYTEDIGDLVLDDDTQILPNEFKPVQEEPSFSYYRHEISPGAHTIRCSGGFVAHIYGIGPNEGYAYTVGSSAKTLSNQLFVNEILSTELPEGYSVCLGEADIQFRAEFNYDYHHVAWDFGDGTQGEGSEVSHTYTASGDFDVKAVVYSEISQPFDTLGVTIHVSPMIEIPVSEITCNPVYTFRGKDYQVPCHEDVPVPGDEGCDTIFHLNIEKGESVSAPPLYDTICSGDSLLWFNNWYHESDTYVEIRPQENNCDSLYLLHLTVVPTHDSIYTEEACGEYIWMGRTYVYNSALGPSNSISDNVLLSHGDCSSNQILDLTLYPPLPSFNQIIGLSNVAVASDFWPGKYVYRLDDETGLDVQRVIWEWVDEDGPTDWVIMPQGASCTIIAYSMGTKVLQISSGNDHCDKQVTKTISCYGYGVDENGIVNLEVYPNPARDELTVKGNGIMEISLYNLLGQKIKTVPVNGDEVVSFGVSDLPQALYLIEIRTKRGNKTQLVSVIK